MPWGFLLQIKHVEKMGFMQKTNPFAIFRALRYVALLGGILFFAAGGAMAQATTDTTTAGQMPPADSSMMREERIDQVVITGTRTPRILKNVPALTRVVTRHEIEAINPRSIDDLLLTAIPGIEYYEHGGQKRMTIQGLGADYYLFLLDGERLCMEGSDAVDFQRINMASIERIEFISGSGSALYGSNSIGGIINIITRDRSKPAEALYHGSYYSYGQQQHSLHLGFKGHGLTSSTDGAFGRLQDYDIPNGVDAEGDPTTAVVPGMMSWNVSQRLGWCSPENRWRISSSGGYSSRLQNESKYMKNRYQSYQAGANAAYQVLPDHSIELNYHLDGYTRAEMYDKKGNVKRFPIFNHAMHTGRMQYNWEPSQSLLPKVNAGYEFLFELLESDRFQKGEKPHHATSNTLYAQCDWHPLAWLAMTAGVRLDIHSRYGAHASPRLSLLFKFLGYQLRASYTQGFRSPNLKELYQDWDHQGMFFIKGNTKLKPEVSHMFILAPEYASPNVNVTLSGSYSIITNRIFLSPAQDDAGRQLMLFTNGKERSQLFTLCAGLRLKLGGGFTESLNYAYLNDMEFDYDTEGRRVRLTTTRPHNFSATTTYSRTFNDYRLSIEFSGRYLSAVDLGVIDYQNKTLRMVRYDGYALFKAGLSHWWKNYIGLTLGIDNLFDYKADRVSIVNTLSPGRNYYVSLSLRY